MRRRPAAAPSNAQIRRPAGAFSEVAQPGSGPLVEAGTRAGWARRQYAWWITFTHPYEETVARLQLRTPSSFTRQEFLDATLRCHVEAGVRLEEAGVFRELHVRRDADGDRVPHLNAIVRSSDQYTWTRVAQKYWELYRIRVDFSENIRTWHDAVVYGTVASQHKKFEELDTPEERLQWALNGNPVPFSEVLPGRMNAQKSRVPKLSNLQAFDLCISHNLRTSTEAWAKAEALSAEGDRGFLSFLLDKGDVEGFFIKVCKATESAETLRRRDLGRLGLLREAAEKPCSCEEGDLWMRLAKETLVRNGVDGRFQDLIYKALEKGRGKPRSIFLMGPTTCAKSWLIKPLSEIYRAYRIPDDGSHKLEAILDCEIIYLNEFEWSPEWLSWAYMKSLFEGDVVNIAVPKIRGTNVDFKSDAPIIGTCASPIQLFMRQGRNAVLNRYETDQMNSRVTYLHFTHSLLQGDESTAIECKVCQRCAARLYLEGQSYALRLPANSLGHRDRSRSPAGSQRPN